MRTLGDPKTVTATIIGTIHSESAAESLCAELEHDGLPIDLAVAEALIAGFIGPRPVDAAEALTLAAERDERVLRHIPVEQRLDLRNPANVKALLRRVGIEVSDTRAWRLEELRDDHPFVDDLLTWRKAERIATTFGYAWLDTNVGADGRLRGRWSGSDGAAGRMTATAGLHNMPADLRPAIVAEPGHVFVRADLGQIEPRILAAVSGDAALASAAQESDMYAPVAARLGVDRDIAKVAVLGAMYGQTTGRGAEALRGLETNYPVAMAYLADAARAAEGGNDLRTRGGRLVRMGGNSLDASDPDGRSRAAARGRYGRNAMVQGAAAEFFKTWAAVVRARLPAVDDRARIVLCLHDELVVHAPTGVGRRRGARARRLVAGGRPSVARRVGRSGPGPVRRRRQRDRPLVGRQIGGRSSRGRASAERPSAERFGEVGGAPTLRGEARDDGRIGARVVVGIPPADLRAEVATGHREIVAVFGGDRDRTLDAHVPVRRRLGLHGQRRPSGGAEQSRLQRVAVHADDHVAVLVLVPDRQGQRSVSLVCDGEDADVHVGEERCCFGVGHRDVHVGNVLSRS